MKISLASDHAGFELKESIKNYLQEKDYLVQDFGAINCDPIDYVDTGVLAALSIANGNSEYGILICGTGQGMIMIANKVKGIRASLCHTTEFAKLARQHNDANVLVLAGRYLDKDIALEIVETFINEPFSEEIRHKNRLEKIKKYEELQHGFKEQKESIPGFLRKYFN